MADQPDLIIFDCDGTLVDTEPLVAQSTSEALAEIGVSLSPEEVRSQFLGLSFADVLARIEVLAGAPLPPDWGDQLKARDEAMFRERLQPIPGAPDLVAAAQAAGRPFCVASSSTPEKLDLTLGLTGLLPAFRGRIFSATMVENGKPAPDLFLFAAQTMGAAPERCIVIEDSVNGVKAGVAAGMPVLAYAGDPLADRAGLAAAGGRLIETLAEARPILQI